MAVVQVIENGGVRLEVNSQSKTGVVTNSQSKTGVVTISDSSGAVPSVAIWLYADDLKALIKRCRTVLAEIEG